MEKVISGNYAVSYGAKWPAPRSLLLTRSRRRLLSSKSWLLFAPMVRWTPCSSGESEHSAMAASIALRLPGAALQRRRARGCC